MKKWLDTIWAPFDKNNPNEWILLGFGYFWLFVVIVMASIDIWK